MTDEIREKIGQAVTGPKNPNWASGSWVHRGYVFIRVPPEERADHPCGIRKDGYMKRSVYTWNKAHPEDLAQRGDVIHHINHDKSDDRPENLTKLRQSAHASLHFKGEPKSEETRANMRAASQRRREELREVLHEANRIRWERYRAERG